MNRLRSPKLFRILVLVGGAVSCAAALVLVGGLPGFLYAGGIAMLAVLLLLRVRRDAGAASDKTGPGWLQRTRKSRLIRELQAELAAATAHAEELDSRMTDLRRRLQDEQATGRRTQATLQAQIEELKSALDDARDSLSNERLRILGLLEGVRGNLARHGEELSTIDQRLEQFVGMAG